MVDRRTDPSLQDLNRRMVVMAAALVVPGAYWVHPGSRWALPRRWARVDAGTNAPTCLPISSRS